MKLVIGNRNYSSWSLRAWLVLRQAAIPFDEIRLSFLSPTFKQDALRHSPTGRVPVLVDGDVTVWDSLAIAEYVAERCASAQLWPADIAARARARSVCAEMHAGFTNLRSQMPMNIAATLPQRGWNIAVQGDIDRIVDIWTELRSRHGAHGAFLFGRFTIADAFFAPVIARFRTYAVDLPAGVARYAQAVWDTAAMQEWVAAAAAEREFVAEDEPYRRPGAA